MTVLLQKGLFVLIPLVAVAELVATATLFSQDTKGDHFTSKKYHDLLIVFLTSSVWSLIFGTIYAYWIMYRPFHFLSSLPASMLWLCLTSIFWGTTTGIFRNTRTGGICDGLPSLSRCRESLTVEALGWTEFALCVFTVIVQWIFTTEEPRPDNVSWRESWFTSQPPMR
ncbi:hypothetical protein M422DRAFT_231894, partial [Sphaerobolus stellatus SS14]